jgi:hypothetical protein
MELGAIISVMVTSGAALSIARGIASWLRARRGVTVTIERHSKSESLKAVVSGLDPEIALRVIETVR